jgi:hypothetical protein
MTIHPFSARLLEPVPSWPVRLVRGLYGISSRDTLNCHQTADNAALDLRAAMLRLRAIAIDEQGRVDYAAVHSSQAFAAYRSAVHRLQSFDPGQLQTDDARKAFWINLYNMLIIHAVIDYGVTNRFSEVHGSYYRAAYIVGGMRYSADDIEHGILRANAGSPFFGVPQFRRDDPRREFIVSRLDPRIHFALNCAARSCPPVGVYAVEHIDQQLDLAVLNFVNNGGLRLSQNTVYLSPIFSWFAGDFGGAWFGRRHQANLLRSIAPFIADEETQRLVIEEADRLRVRFVDYDWSLNAQSIL